MMRGRPIGFAKDGWRGSRSRLLLTVLALATGLAWPTALGAQPASVSTDDLAPLPPLRWRNIGPKRGGRSIAVAGSPARPFEYYFGATGGGLWKTTDGASTWFPVTDGQVRSSSVGAVAVSESNPDVVYIGMGEAQLRQNVLQGDGVYRSTDAGRSWAHVGLAETQAISRVRIHPDDPDRVYVAALGHPFGPNPERGVFRTLDGGRTWEKVLFRDERTGAIDLVFDPSDPDVLYATLWEVYRKPWILWSGGEGSGIFKTTDGTRISRPRRAVCTDRTTAGAPGLSSTTTGISGSAPSTSCASRPIRSIETPSTSSTSASSSPRMEVVASIASRTPTPTTTTSGSTRATLLE